MAEMMLSKCKNNGINTKKTISLRLTVVKDKKVNMAATGAATENIIRTFRTLVLSAP